MTEVELDRLAAIWAANPILRRCGITYGDLVDAPHIILGALLTPPPPAPETRPLLPAQRRIARRIAQQDLLREAVAELELRLDRDVPGARRRGGGYVEPLHHRAWAVSHERRLPGPLAR